MRRSLSETGGNHAHPLSGKSTVVPSGSSKGGASGEMIGVGGSGSARSFIAPEPSACDSTRNRGDGSSPGRPRIIGTVRSVPLGWSVGMTRRHWASPPDAIGSTSKTKMRRASGDVQVVGAGPHECAGADRLADGDAADLLAVGDVEDEHGAGGVVNGNERLGADDGGGAGRGRRGQFGNVAAGA